MVIQIDDDFDLDKIADSGQCFRWEKQEKRGSGDSHEKTARIPDATRTYKNISEKEVEKLLAKSEEVV